MATRAVNQILSITARMASATTDSDAPMGLARRGAEAAEEACGIQLD